MASLPFSCTDETRAFLLDFVRQAKADSAFAGLLPTLLLGRQSRLLHNNGDLLQWQDDYELHLGAYYPEQATDMGLLEFELLGESVLLHPEHARFLDGKEVFLETPEHGQRCGHQGYSRLRVIERA